jgi:hypothetical protein
MLRNLCIRRLLLKVCIVLLRVHRGETLPLPEEGGRGRREREKREGRLERRLERKERKERRI